MQAVNNVDGVAKKKCDNAEGDVHGWGSLWAHGREPCVTQKPILKSHKFSIDS